MSEGSGAKTLERESCMEQETRHKLVMAWLLRTVAFNLTFTTLKPEQQLREQRDEPARYCLLHHPPSTPSPSLVNIQCISSSPGIEIECWKVSGVCRRQLGRFPDKVNNNFGCSPCCLVIGGGYKVIIAQH